MKRLFILLILCFLFTACMENDYIKTWTITVSSSNDTLGYVTGDGEYTTGTTATIEAFNLNDGHFDKWGDGCLDNPRQVVVTCDSVFVAQFVRYSTPQQPDPISIDTVLLIGKWRVELNSPTISYVGYPFFLGAFQFNADHSGIVDLHSSDQNLVLQIEWMIQDLFLIVSAQDENGSGFQKMYTCFEQSENMMSLTDLSAGRQFGLVRIPF